MSSSTTIPKDTIISENQSNITHSNPTLPGSPSSISPSEWDDSPSRADKKISSPRHSFNHQSEESSVSPTRKVTSTLQNDQNEIMKAARAAREKAIENENKAKAAAAEASAVAASTLNKPKSNMVTNKWNTNRDTGIKPTVVSVPSISHSLPKTEPKMVQPVIEVALSNPFESENEVSSIPSHDTSTTTAKHPINSGIVSSNANSNANTINNNDRNFHFSSTTTTSNVPLNKPGKLGDRLSKFENIAHNSVPQPTLNDSSTILNSVKNDSGKISMPKIFLDDGTSQVPKKILMSQQSIGAVFAQMKEDAAPPAGFKKFLSFLFLFFLFVVWFNTIHFRMFSVAEELN